MTVAQKRRGGWLYLLIAFSPGVVLVLFVAGVWLFSTNEYKVPPSGVVAVPAGFEVVGGDTDGGSGGTTIRWLFIEAPEGHDAESGIAELKDAMAREGWELANSPPECCIPSSTYGLIRRGDEWAGFESARSISDWTYEFLDLDRFDRRDTALIVVVLEYEDWGVGRRQLFN